MWIKLISPRVTLRPMDSHFKRHMAPPLALLVLGALTPARHRVTVEDENVERLHLKDSPDLVGITVKADTAVRSYEIARHYRRRGIPVVLGGIHPTACPAEALKHADSVVIGDAEELWGALLEDFETGIPKPVYRVARKTDLAKSPIPRWDLIKGKNYLYTNTLCAGRGCPWNCDFCYNSSPNVPRGHRMKPLTNILAEIESLKSRQVMFIDDNFIGDPQSARHFLKHYMPEGLTWHTAVSVDVGQHDDILDLMADSGCKSLFIGFETLNDENLLNCSKKQNRVREYERTIRKIHERGMMVNASLVFGFDHDGPEVFANTLDWLVAQKVASMTAHILTPYPGTRLYKRLLEQNRIIDFDLRRYNTSHVVFRPKRLTPEQLLNGYRWIYSQFYSWRRILQRMPASGSQRAAYLMFNLCYRKYGKVFSMVGRLGLMGPIARFAKALSYRSGKPETEALPQWATDSNRSDIRCHQSV